MGVLLETCGRTRCLLLMSLFLFVVFKAAADCPKPTLEQNTILSQEALLMNTFEDGSTVTIECANGYVAKSGSGKKQCLNSQWTEADLNCQKRDCGTPKQKPHMTFDLSQGTLFGATIRVYCDTGYEIIGTSYSQCFANGWSGKTNCEIVTCEKPNEVPNGKMLWDSQDDPKYREFIHFLCNEGYTLVGNSSIMCSDTGDYTSEPPHCQGVTTTTDVTKGVTKTQAPSPTPAKTDSAAPSISIPLSDTTTSATLTSQDSAAPSISIPLSDTTTSATLTSQGNHENAVNTSKDVEPVAIIIPVIGSLTVLTVLTAIFYKFRLRRKGSYDTREDLKLDFSQFQTL